MNIKTIPEDELRKDLQDSYADITLCKVVLQLGIVSRNGESVQDRLTINQQIVVIILAELARRGIGETK